MNIRIRLFFALFLGIFFMAGCGKTVIESGDYMADVMVASVGKFDTVIVDIPFFENGFSCVDAYCSDSGYSYILNDYYTYLNRNDYYYLVLDLNGKEKISEALELPIYSDGNSLRISSEYYLGELSDHHFSVENGYISYNNMQFDYNGNISSVCCVGVNYDEPGISGGIYREYFVSWDSSGKCISVSESENSEYAISEGTVLIDFDPYNEYKASLSGIINVDEDGCYISKYFDFINSDIRANGFDIAVIKDVDHFSGIYSDENGYTHMGCFIRNDSKRHVKPLVLACSSVNDQILDYVFEFNERNSDYRIVIDDYSERTESGTSSEGWTLLKKDIDTGFKPDMIFNTTGFDSVFIDDLSSQSLLCDLTGVIHGDSNSSETVFTGKASGLYYGSEKIYSIVPSYSYYSVVGNINDFGEFKNWGYGDYIGFVSELEGKYTVFYLDTCTSFVERMLEYNGNDYVNYEIGSSDFDSDEFVSLLKYASSLPCDPDEAMSLMYSDINLGNYLLNDVQCHNLGDMNYFSTLYSMGDYIDIGFPHGASGEGSGVISADLSIMIMSTNAYSNECWGFCKQYLSPEYQENILTGIPVTVSGYNSWKTKTYVYSYTFDNYTYVKDGVEYTVPPVDEKIAGDILSRIESCHRISFSDYNVEKIVLDYASRYFDGEFSAEEAASYIDRDVEAYLAS